MSAQSEAINQSIVDSVLDMVATIYTRAASGGFTVVQRADLPCRLDEVQGGRSPGATAAQRRELAGLGTFRWDATYDLPETGVQIEVDAYPGKRWNPVAATQWPDIVPGIGIIGRSCEVVRAIS